MIKKRPSMKDIAREANVSVALVSYVLNGKEKESRVGKEVSLKIKRIAKELNYEPNYLAKSLRSGKTQTLGLILADISNPFFANIARIVEDEARHNGYTVVIGSSDESALKSSNLMDVLINRQVDGFIIISSEKSEKQISYLIDKNIPFVLLDRYFPELQTNQVSIDHYRSAFDAGKHLADNGYRRIGFIAYQSKLHHMQERVKGYTESLKDTGLAFNKKWLQKINIHHIEDEIKTAIDVMIAGDDRVDAIIFATYSLAVNGLKYIDKLGLKIPKDIAIVSFGQAEGFDLYYCPITYIWQPMDELGKNAVDILIKKIRDPKQEIKQILLESKLMARESSERK
ncbi:MAG TPA: LacI family DNA-binding transcriptional regulator [Mucilaginibacter sp.]|nr:LacI family DNA-binding transcriptional regulator [Mucilaginibacter sp.]